jgi:IS5 family transposase
MEKQKKYTMADTLISGRQRKIKNQFFDQVNDIINWKPVVKIIEKFYKKRFSATGQPAYSGLLLFKTCLLQTWYGLSDYEVEDRINDSLSFSNFLEMSVEDTAPDHSTISRFRSLMSNHNVYEELLNEINKQLDEHHILVKTGVIVDASVVPTERRPRRKPGYEIVKDRAEEEPSKEDIEKEKEEKKYQEVHEPAVDVEAAWIKKMGKFTYGYKRHTITDKNGLVLCTVTTPANVNEISNLEDLLNKVKLEPCTEFYGDKGYQSKKNRKLLADRKLNSRILHKGTRGRKITKRERQINKIWGRTRYKVERTFGSIKRWFNGGIARYVGIKKTHTQNLMESMAYNLYRSPGLILANGEIL